MDASHKIESSGILKKKSHNLVTVQFQGLPIITPPHRLGIQKQNRKCRHKRKEGVLFLAHESSVHCCSSPPKGTVAVAAFKHAKERFHSVLDDRDDEEDDNNNNDGKDDRDNDEKYSNEETSDGSGAL